MINVKKMKFREFTDGRGCLTPIESLNDIPFEIKRIYYITGVPCGIDRGFHSHNNLEQVLICLNGSVTIQTECDESCSFVLDNPTEGLYIGSMVWRKMTYFSDQAVLLVLASEYHRDIDYIRDYEVFRKAADRYLEDLRKIK